MGFTQLKGIQIFLKKFMVHCQQEPAFKFLTLRYWLFRNAQLFDAVLRIIYNHIMHILNRFFGNYKF